MVAKYHFTILIRLNFGKMIASFFDDVFRRQNRDINVIHI